MSSAAKFWNNAPALLRFLPLLLLLACESDSVEPTPPAEAPPQAPPAPPPPPPPVDPKAVPYREAFANLGFTLSETSTAGDCTKCHLGSGEPRLKSLTSAEGSRRFLDPALNEKLGTLFGTAEERAAIIQVLQEHPKPDLLSGPHSSHVSLDCAACHVSDDRADEPGMIPERLEAWQKAYMRPHPVVKEIPLRQAGRAESSCLKCHPGEDPLPGADRINRGRILYKETGCYGCHLAPGMKVRPEDLLPGERRVRRLGPPLKNIAVKVDKAWTKGWIHHPEAFKPTGRMPFFFPRGELNLPPQLGPQVEEAELPDIESVLTSCTVEYLFSISQPLEFPDPPPALLETVDWKMEDQADRGRKLAVELGCLACHRIDENYPFNFRDSISYLEEEFATNLMGTGSKLDTPRGKRWLYSWLKNPSHYFSDTTMPDFRLSDAEIGDLMQFLLSLKVDNGTRDERKLTRWEPIPPAVSIKDGQATAIPEAESILDRLLKHQGGPTDAPLREKILWEGRKIVETFACYACHDMGGEWDGKPAVMGPISKALLPPKGFMERMPLYYLDMKHAGLISTYQRALFDALDPVRTKPDPRRKALADGERILIKYNCKGCHILEESQIFVREDGRIIPAFVLDKGLVEDDPEITEPTRAIHWLRHAATLEPAPLKERPDLMPEASIDRISPPRGGTYVGRRTAVGSTVEAGRVPPSLRTVGRKLRTSWLREYLRNPERLRPGDAPRMPTFHFAEGEIEVLVEYFRLRDGSKPDDAEGKLTLSDVKVRFPQLLKADVYVRKTCLECHRLDGQGRDMGADLGALHLRLQRPWLEAFLKDPGAVYPRTPMPKMIPEGQLQDIVDLLLNYDSVREVKVDLGNEVAVMEALAVGGPQKRELAFQALSRAGEADLKPAVVAALHTIRDHRWGGRTEITALLTHASAHIRTAAVEAEGTAENLTTASLEALAARLQDSDAGVRRAALLVLARPDAASQAENVALVLKDELPSMRERALRTLASMGGSDSATLAAAALSDADALVRRATLETLEVLGAVDQGAGMAPLLQDPETPVRIRAAEVLGALGILDQEEALTAAAMDGPLAARWAALMALARLGRAPEQIRALLQDTEPSIRAAGAACFIRTADPEGRAALLKVLQHPPYSELTQPALRLAISFEEASELTTRTLSPGSKSLKEWLDKLGVAVELEEEEEQALDADYTARQGPAAQLLAAVALRIRAAFIEKNGGILLVSQSAAVDHILSR